MDENESMTETTSPNEEFKTPFEDWLDNNFEANFFRLRFILLVPILISFAGSIVTFALGGINIYKSIEALVIKKETASEAVILPLVKGLDAFLIGIILIIFSFGIYDFFVSELDPAEHAGIRKDWFKFDSTGELKSKLIELILVILAILFFENMIGAEGSFDNPASYLIIPLGAAILAISIGFFKWATEE